MRRRDMPAALLAAAAGVAGEAAVSRAESAGPAPWYPQTEAEVSAKVTPTNSAFPPGNVRRYGAGDGHTPDEVAFQNACAANDYVFVPRGNYVFNSQVNVDRSSITITGENHGSGAASIRLARAAGRGAAVFRWNSWAANVQVSNLAILLKNAGAAQVGLRFAEVRASRITNCYIEGLADKGNDTTAIQFDGSGTYSGDVDVENCYLTAHRIAVDLQRVCTTVRVLNCEVYGTQRLPDTIGVRVSAASAGVLISGNTFEGWGVGVYTEGCYIKQIGNYFEDNSAHWHWVRGAGRSRIWNSSFGDTCLGGGAPVYPRNDLDSCIVFGQTANLVDSGYIEASRGFRERNRAFNLGEWTTPVFAAEHFSGSGGMTWTVRPANVQTYAYTMIGQSMTVSWVIAGSVIAGRMDKALQLAIPGGYTPARLVRAPTGILGDGPRGIGVAEVAAGRPFIHIYPTPDRLTDHSPGPAELFGQITFEIR
jgi:Pectate lyase superfamily protein